MIKLKKICDKIIDDRKLDKDTYDLNRVEGDENYYFYTLEGINLENGVEEKYLLYDCSNKDNNFNYDQYIEKISEEVDLISIFLFKNWDDEIQQYYKSYDKLTNGIKRKKLKGFFNRKISFYTDIIDLEDNLKLHVNEPENYNEYIVENETNVIEGYIYNFSLKELKKLFNITGIDLFKENVRKGLKKNSTIDEIKKNFRNYLHTYLYLEVENILDKKYIDSIEEIKNELNLSYSSINCPEYFWFCHNGITIFSYDKNKLDRSGNHISLCPSNVSVINGAQTLTNFYLELENSKRVIPKIFSKFEIDEETVLKLLDEAYGRTIVKTIFIDGKREFVKPITYGLNRQVPILNEHILADSDSARKIDVILKKKNMEILKEGDTPIYGKGMDILEFTKKYLIIEKKPGKSKNLNKKIIPSIVEKSLEKIKENESYYLYAFDFLLDLDSWWQSSKKTRESMYKTNNHKILNSYGKNYFGSYLISRMSTDYQNYGYDDNYFDIQYFEFVKKICDTDKILSLSDFKKDDLFDEYIKTNNSTKNTDVDSNVNIDLIELKEYLNNKNVVYTMNNVISGFLSDNGIKLEYFRVIQRKEKKCKEAFPFPNRCFSEIYSNNDLSTDLEQSDLQYLNDNFGKSKFKNEILKKFPVFVIEYTKENNIDKIQYIPEFTFQSYEKKAEKVFDITIEAFFKGDELSFPKTSDDLCFHVRPKAINSKDTFEFTNGEQITKRTFWANKSTVETLVDNFLKNK